MGMASFTTNGILEGPYLMGESRQTYEQLLKSLGPSDLFIVYLILKIMMMNK